MAMAMIILGVVLMIAFGLLFIISSKKDLRKLAKAKEWPFVEGKIILQHYNTTLSAISDPPPKKLKYKFASIHSRYSNLWLQYEYSVDGITYINERYSFGYITGVSRKRFKELKEKFQLGSNVRVFYNPFNPKDSVLSLATNQSYGLLILGYYFFIIGVIIFFILYYKFIERIMPITKKGLVQQMRSS